MLLWEEQENTSHRMALYLLTSQTPKPAGNWRQNRTVLRQPLAPLASGLAEILELAHKLIALLGYNVTEGERECTFSFASC